MLCQLSYTRKRRKPLPEQATLTDTSSGHSTQPRRSHQLFPLAKPAPSRRTPLLLPRLLVQRMTAKLRAILHQLKALSPSSLLTYPVIPQPRLRAFQPNILTHCPSLPAHAEAARGAKLLILAARAARFILSTQTSTFSPRPKTPLASNQARTFVTIPEPTVRPPSRIAKRLPSTSAIGLPNSTSRPMLSPGIHISAPPSNLTPPVTSVVRK